MKKSTYALNILSAIPGVVLVPLSPFALFIVDGEGRVPGLLHERVFIALLFAYPALLPICLWRSLAALRRERRRALLIAAAPLACALALTLVFVAGGMRLR